MGWMSGYSSAASEAFGRAQDEERKSLTRLGIALQLPYIKINRLPFWGPLPALSGWKGGGELWHGLPGHYWIEIDHGDPDIWESYGWYPASVISAKKHPVDAGGQLLGYNDLVGAKETQAVGCINGDSDGRQKVEETLGPLAPEQEHAAGFGPGRKPFPWNHHTAFPWDPHQGNTPRSMSNPWIAASRAKEDVIARIRDFAAGYAKSSNGLWTFRDDSAGENNCHTFIWKLLDACDLADFNLLDSATDPHFAHALHAPGSDVAPALRLLGDSMGPAWMKALKAKTQKVKDALDNVK